MNADPELMLRSIGRVTRGRPRPPDDKRWNASRQEAEIELDPAWAGALDGVEAFSHLWVVWWLDRAAADGLPAGLHVHPEGRQEMPEIGLFATRTPLRPNPIALTAVHLLERQGSRLRVTGLDAYEGTPILDLKPYLRRGDLILEATAPDWLERLWQIHDREG
jgi:tRNA-Thr(GGU) m(6)t(6)A37 methyltransferase TsaA